MEPVFRRRISKGQGGLVLLEGFWSTGVFSLGCPKKAVTTALQTMSMLLCANVFSKVQPASRRHWFALQLCLYRTVLGFFEQFGPFSSLGKMLLFLSSLMLWMP